MHMKTVAQFKELLAKRPEPKIKIAVETGTFRGDSTLLLSPAVQTWYTIDIDPGFIKLARNRCARAGRANIVYKIGDSRRILPEILKQIPEACIIMLDAHFSKVGRQKSKMEPVMKHGAKGADFPLLDELRIISSRPYADIVLIDDTHLFGVQRPDLRAHTGNGKKDESPQWESMTHDIVEKILGRVTNRLDWYTSTVYWRSKA